MKKTRKILLYAITLILLLSAVTAVMTACSSSDKANQDINPIVVLRAVIDKLELNPDDIGLQYYSEGDEEHSLTDIDIMIMFPPVFDETGNSTVVHSLDLFLHYAIVRYEKAMPEIFEIGIFKIDRFSPLNDVPFKNNMRKVENMCKERLVKVKGEIFEYNKEKAYYADNSTVEVFDNYVYYIIAENSEAAYETVKYELTHKK